MCFRFLDKLKEYNLSSAALCPKRIVVLYLWQIYFSRGRDGFYIYYAVSKSNHTSKICRSNHRKKKGQLVDAG